MMPMLHFKSRVLCGCRAKPFLHPGDLFFTDWSDMDINVRMKNWDRKFKTLTSYPQVGVWCEAVRNFLAMLRRIDALPDSRNGRVNRQP
jgi:hypothetical protein